MIATNAAIEKPRFVRSFLAACAVIATVLAVRIACLAYHPLPVAQVLNVFPLSLGMLLAGAYFTWIWFHPVLAALWLGAALTGLATFHAADVSLLVVHAGRHLPLADSWLLAADRFIGFEWTDALRLFDRFAALDPVLKFAYRSIELQPVVIVCLLAVTGQPGRLFGLITSCTVALSLTQAIGMHCPALGPYEIMAIGPGDHANISLITEAKMTAGIHWLRTSALAPPFPEIPLGLISFPSFHAACAALYAWSLWRTPYARWIGAALNALMVLATPIHGSHYGVDVLAGFAVAAVALALTSPLFMLAAPHLSDASSRLPATSPMTVVADRRAVCAPHERLLP